MLALIITTPSLLAPFARPALRVRAVHMSASGSTADYLASTIGPRRSFLDSTDKFDEIAAGAALAGSAAESLGREPGTCDPYDPKSSEFCMDEPEERSDLKRTVRLGVLFFAWYFLNTAYNIGNKLVLTAFPMPWTAATWELFFGFPYVFFLWTTGERRAEPSRRAARPTTSTGMPRCTAARPSWSARRRAVTTARPPRCAAA